jgi:hypothetical protein
MFTSMRRSLQSDIDLLLQLPNFRQHCVLPQLFAVQHCSIASRMVTQRKENIIRARKLGSRITTQTPDWVR